MGVANPELEPITLEIAPNWDEKNYWDGSYVRSIRRFGTRQEIPAELDLILVVERGEFYGSGWYGTTSLCWAGFLPGVNEEVPEEYAGFHGRIVNQIDVRADIGTGSLSMDHLLALSGANMIGFTKWEDLRDSASGFQEIEDAVENGTVF